jgi:hypothetical protein
MYSNFIGFGTIFIYFVPLTLMLKHRVFYYLSEYKSQVMTAKV